MMKEFIAPTIEMIDVANTANGAFDTATETLVLFNDSERSATNSES